MGQLNAGQTRCSDQVFVFRCHRSQGLLHDGDDFRHFIRFFRVGGDEKVLSRPGEGNIKNTDFFAEAFLLVDGFHFFEKIYRWQVIFGPGQEEQRKTIP